MHLYEASPLTFHPKQLFLLAGGSNNSALGGHTCLAAEGFPFSFNPYACFSIVLIPFGCPGIGICYYPAFLCLFDCICPLFPSLRHREFHYLEIPMLFILLITSILASHTEGFQIFLNPSAFDYSNLSLYGQIGIGIRQFIKSLCRHATTQPLSCRTFSILTLQRLEY